MRKYLAFPLIASLLFTGGCAMAPQTTKSPLELQAIQAKEFETTKKVAFASTLSVFQDLGYVVGNANLETGLISAKSPTQQSFVPFVGQVMKDVQATAFVEEIVPGRTKVRLNFVNSTQTSSGYGMRGAHDQPIEDPQVYQDVFSKVQQAIFIRQNVN
ncbi:hypothetical protein [Thiobacillus sedimenti]|uniref:DUF4136 domain-containing protein n=1 Tax=Thiobacillus sedimenti TaxID=3110231 RepID=A0ABZ1CKS1_9PROT|nr:hypothetical protein [Thiobacillus sp. SCUT-2]WRS39565.1 hypothetical protein VA613_01475 [Thiobacillus sp. SCUT-2]